MLLLLLLLSSLFRSFATSAFMSLHYFNQWYVVLKIEGGAWMGRKAVVGMVEMAFYSGAPLVKKCGRLPIRENLVIT